MALKRTVCSVSVKVENLYKDVILTVCFCVRVDPGAFLHLAECGFV